MTWSNAGSFHYFWLCKQFLFREKFDHFSTTERRVPVTLQMPLVSNIIRPVKEGIRLLVLALRLSLVVLQPELKLCALFLIIHPFQRVLHQLPSSSPHSDEWWKGI